MRAGKVMTDPDIAAGFHSCWTPSDTNSIKRLGTITMRCVVNSAVEHRPSRIGPWSRRLSPPPRSWRAPVFGKIRMKIEVERQTGESGVEHGQPDAAARYPGLTGNGLPDLVSTAGSVQKCSSQVAN